MGKKRSGVAVAEALRVINHHYEPDCPLNSLKLHPDNPRQADCGAIHESVEHNGFYGAIIAQLSTRTVLAGKHRYITASQLGAKTIPTMWVDVDDATALKIVLADNRVSDRASYDNNILAGVLDQLRESDDWLGTGWDEEAYQDLLSDLKGIEPSNEPESDDSESAGKAHETCPNCGYALP